MKLLILSLLITFVSYFKIIQGFFQQDEWIGYSEYILRQGLGFTDLLKYFFEPSTIHFTPFTLATLYLNLSNFGMNYIPHVIVSLSLHLIVIILIYVLSNKIFESRNKAGVVTLLFSSFSSIQQATSWVMADIGTHGATIFGILSMIFFYDFLKTKINSKLYYSLLSLFISLMFKEITIGLFPIMLFLLWQYGRLKKSFSIILLGTIYVFIRIWMILISTNTSLAIESQDNIKLIYDFFTIPIKAISQSIIPIEIIRGISEFIARLFPQNIASEIGSPAFEVFVVKRVMEAISLLISILISIPIIFKKNISKTSKLGLIWVIVNSFIFAFSPQRNGITSVIDSRNLYFVAIGTSLIITSVFYQYKIKFVFLLILIISNLYFLNTKLNSFVETSRLRRNILNNIITSVPDLPEKVVFYTQSNQSYYGLAEEIKIMPFQSGFGQTLLAWYYQKEKFPDEFFVDRFLWGIDSQGYREVNGVGFGYFRDLDLLNKTVKQYNLPKESIISFSWDGREEKLKYGIK